MREASKGVAIVVFAACNATVWPKENKSYYYVVKEEEEEEELLLEKKKKKLLTVPRSC